MISYHPASGYMEDDRCRPQCSLSSDPGYVIYSAVGSFFAPLLVMIFFNCKIYQAAKKTTKALCQGYTKVKSDGKYIGGMGVHRGSCHANLIKVKINGNFQSEFELDCKKRSGDNHIVDQLSIKSAGSTDSFYHRNSFSSKSLSGINWMIQPILITCHWFNFNTEIIWIIKKRQQAQLGGPHSEIQVEQD